MKAGEFTERVIVEDLALISAPKVSPTDLFFYVSFAVLMDFLGFPVQLFDGGLGQTICLGRAAWAKGSFERWPEVDAVEAERKCAGPGLHYWMEVARVFLGVSGRKSSRSGTVAAASSAIQTVTSQQPHFPGQRDSSRSFPLTPRKKIFRSL